MAGGRGEEVPVAQSEEGPEGAGERSYDREVAGGLAGGDGGRLGVVRLSAGVALAGCVELEWMAGGG